MRYILIIVAFVLFLLAREQKTKNRNLYNLIIVITYILLVLYSGLREYILPIEEIGTDYYNYKNWFYTKSGLTIQSFSNIGFIILIKILNNFNFNYIFLFITASFIILLGVFKYILKNSRYCEVSIYIYISLGLLLSGFNIIRQWIACSVFLMAYEYLKRKNFKMYLIMILLASTFHASALFLILLYPVLNSNIKIYKRILFAVILVVLLLSSDFTMALLANTKIVDSNFYNRYVSGKMESQSNYVIFCIALINLLIILFNIKTYKKNSEYWSIELNYLILLCAFSFAAPTHIIYNRAVIYFTPALLITVPNTISLVKREYRNFIYFAIMIIYLIPYI